MKKLGLLAAAFIGAATLTAKPAAAQYAAFVTADMTLRSGPDYYYPPVGVMPAGAPVRIYGCVAGWLWCDVAWGYERGWLPGQFLTVNYGPQPMPLLVYAPRFQVPIVFFSVDTYWVRYYKTKTWYVERTRWVNWDYKGRRWKAGWDDRKWDPKRHDFDRRRGDDFDRRHGDDKNKPGNWDPKKQPAQFDNKNKPAQFDNKNKPAQYDNKENKNKGQKQEQKKGDKGKGKQDD